MRKAIYAWVLLGSVAFMARGQVSVDLVLDQEQFLRSESLPVRVKISNFSGQTLRLGGQPDWLSFTIEAEQGVAPSKTGELPLPKPFEIESSKTVSLRADLMPIFDLNVPGHYSITVKVKMPQIEKELSVGPKEFDIITGTKLWEKEVGVPGTTPPVVRRFALQQATFLKQLRLYVRLTDVDELKVIRVLPLGTLLSFSAPEVLVDRSSQLHVLFQVGPRSFLYSVVTTDGDLIIRQTHDYSDTRPHLRAEPDGRVVVTGGQRNVSLTDLPPPRGTNVTETVAK